MFKKILIANRGEIALRIICACKELGIKTVAVYSEADRLALHVHFADEAICIGPPRSSESYMNIPHIISAAEVSGADAVHPGYGFLAENANFAEVCETSGITFIGPRSDLIRLMGEKERARQEMVRAGLSVLPGSDGVVPSESEARRVADRIGYPLMIKAAAGGGGRGMRVVWKESDLPALFSTAQHEAQQAFGTSDVYLEKFLPAARHVEFQVLGDQHGKVIHLGERDCSLQRRHQKMVEESPSPAVNEEMRRRMGEQVMAAMSAIGYSNAGTVEFLLDEEGNFYFIEMNTRIQVEHPVTEMVTGTDLIKAQIQLALGGRVEFIARSRLRLRGHAIECRIVAEDPETFRPSAGRITAFHMPGGTGVRIDTAAYAEAVIPPYYDSLIAKLIVHGRDREEALGRMARALEMFVIEGIHTSIPTQRKIVADPDFRGGRYDTRFMERFVRSVRPDLPLAEVASAVAAGGVRWVQLRAKQATSRGLFEEARQLLSLLPAECSLIINDRADVAALTGAAGVHLGQDDLPVAAARALLGRERTIGLSTHNQEQLEAAQALPVDYLAFGPVFATTTKPDTEPVVGLDRLRELRRRTNKPLVAIGGITTENAASVLAAGADSVAVISGWLAAEDIPQRLEEFRRVLGRLD